MQHNLIARIQSLCSTPLPLSLAQHIFPSYPKQPNPEICADQLISELCEQEATAILSDSEAAAQLYKTHGHRTTLTDSLFTPCALDAEHPALQLFLKLGASSILNLSKIKQSWTNQRICIFLYYETESFSESFFRELLKFREK